MAQTGQKLPLHLHKQLTSLKTHAKALAPVSLNNISAFASSLGPVGLLDRFKLTFSYLGRKFDWLVILNGANANIPPDFIFDDAMFLPDPSDIPSLFSWRDDVDALTGVVTELLMAYRKFHLKQALSHENVFMQTELAFLHDYNADHLVLCGPRASSGRPVFIQVPVALPANIYESSSVSPEPLQISVDYVFPDVQSASPFAGAFVTPIVTTKVSVPPSLLSVIKKPITVPWTTNSTIADYIQAVKAAAEAEVGAFADGITLRRQYIAALLSVFAGALLEYDEEKFLRASFLFELKQFSSIVHVELDENFPRNCPKFTLQSIYHERAGRVFEKVYGDYPYSPRWPADQMALRNRMFLEEALTLFRDESMKMVEAPAASV